MVGRMTSSELEMVWKEAVLTHPVNGLEEKGRTRKTTVKITVTQSRFNTITSVIQVY
jgi:hypothetical protein